MGECMCDSSDPSVSRGDLLSQEEKGEKLILPQMVTKTGYIYAVSACIKYTNGLNKVDAGIDELKVTEGVAAKWRCLK